MGPKEVDNLSHVPILSGESFHQGYPVEQGIYDAGLGSTQEQIECKTCRNRNDWCPGHHGSYTLSSPVPSPLPMALILRWLKIICWSCGNLLSQKIPPAKIDSNDLMTFYIKYSKGIESCPHCEADTFVAKLHKPDYPLSYVKIQTSDIPLKKAKYSLDDGYDTLTYAEIADIFARVTEDTVKKVGMPVQSHPSKLLISKLLITATSIRPEIRTPDKKHHSNDITNLYRVIIDQNDGIPNPLPSSDKLSETINNKIYLLSLAVHVLVKGSDNGNKKDKGITLFSNTGRDFMGLGSRFPQKNGQWRQNLFGKRCHNIVRAVITGDSHIPLGTVSIPMDTARTIRIFEEVREFNYANMTRILKNGMDVYPGCSMIIRKDTGRICEISGLPAMYKLQLGDILLRDLVDGDWFNYNRQPTLSMTSIAGYQVKILKSGNTLRMNPGACKWHAADFDGDCMVGIVAQNEMAIVEIKYMSGTTNFVVSPQTGTPIPGAFQDSLIGIAMMTTNKFHSPGHEPYEPRISRFKAMQLFATVDRLGIGNTMATWDFTQDHYNNRDLVSRILPSINVSSPAKFYNPKFRPYLKYDEKDIHVEIRNGQLLQGMLDADTIGQGAKGGIIHVVHNEYGPKAALDFIHNIDRITSKFHLWQGFSISLHDITIREETRNTISNNIANIIAQANDLTDKLHTGELRPPTGVSLRDFYEEQQVNILQPGDGFLYPALTDVDLYNNGIVMLMLVGSKGKMASNFVSLIGMVGRQDIGGSMPPANVGVGRTSPFFNNFDPDPQSMGFVTQSFLNGINGIVYLYCAQEARNALINQALTTATAGAANRSAIKNFENQVLDPIGQVVKSSSIIQPLYGGTGFDTRKIEVIKIPTITLSDAELEEKFKCTQANIQPEYNNKATQQMLQAEFKQLKEDRDYYRKVTISTENENVIKFIRVSDKRGIPMNIPRIIKNVKYSTQELSGHCNPSQAITMVRQLCSNMQYLYCNQRWEEQKKYVPPHYKSATTMSQIAVRAYLCTRELIRNDISIKQLELIIAQIRFTFKKAIMNYGGAVGILAAQCFSEPFTQEVLSSKHKSGAGGGSTTSAITKVSEIQGAVPTKNMENPSMRIFIDPSLEENEDAVRDVANRIEMVSIKDVVAETQIFFEKLGEPIHSRFKHEAAWINKFRKLHSSIKPRNLLNYCIRFKLNREKLILKSLSLHTVVTSIQREFPHLYQVYTAENEDNIVIRLYPSYDSLRKQSSKTMKDDVMDIMNTVRNHLIRGVSGIMSTQVTKVLRTRLKPDGSIDVKPKEIFVIDTRGSNLEEILSCPQVDPTRTQSDSVIEMAEMYGIECGRTKIINEFRNLISSTDLTHLSIYADEMVSPGIVTSIERSGTAKRDRTNITQRASFGAPLQVLVEAATYNYTERIHGTSGHLAMGTVPRCGTLYPDVLIDGDFILKHRQQSIAALDEI
jgi:DNA-directed RNA polymerase II subunit RPB1